MVLVQSFFAAVQVGNVRHSLNAMQRMLCSVKEWFSFERREGLVQETALRLLTLVSAVSGEPHVA
jgi:hypothetical protein